MLHLRPHHHPCGLLLLRKLSPYISEGRLGLGVSQEGRPTQLGRFISFDTQNANKINPQNVNVNCPSVSKCLEQQEILTVCSSHVPTVGSVESGSGKPELAWKMWPFWSGLEQAASGLWDVLGQNTPGRETRLGQKAEDTSRLCRWSRASGCDM